MQQSELQSSLENIYQQLESRTHGASDDINSLLEWLNPNDMNSNHQLKPPTIRLKNIIKKFVSDVNIVGNVEILESLRSILRYYYIYQLRINYFANFNSIITFKDMVRLEKFYEYPLQHVPIFDNYNYEWENELNKLRHYLVTSNMIYRKNLISRLQKLISEDDFDLAQQIINWINETNSSALSSKEIILNSMLDKISDYAEKQMSNSWSQRFLIMETYNKFITKYWNSFTILLDCAEDDHETTKTLYKYFEKQFLRIKSKEIFDICSVNYPDSRPTIMELRGLLAQTKNSSSLLIRLLSEFHIRVLNPSIPTCTILLSYVKTVKALLTLDPTSRYLQSFTSFVNPFLQQRNDLIHILLFSILNLQEDDLQIKSTYGGAHRPLELLSEELREPNFGIETSLSDINLSEEANTGSVDNTKTINTLNTENSQLLYSQVLNRALTWLPESKLVPSNKSNKLLRKKNLLDILFEIFEDHELFVKKFVELLKSKLFITKGYSLDGSWLQCLRLFKNKISPNSIDSATAPTNLESLTGNNNNFYMNNIDVMLWDMKFSKKLNDQMHLIEGLDKRIQIKIISLLYWQHEAKNQKIGAVYDILAKMDHNLTTQLEKYVTLYSKLKPGRTLNLLKDHGSIDIDFEFEDNRTVSCECNLQEYIAICPFMAINRKSTYSLDDLLEVTTFEPEVLKKALKFWLDQKVLYFDGLHYRPLEYLAKPEVIVEEMDMGNILTGGTDKSDSTNASIMVDPTNDAITRRGKLMDARTTRLLPNDIMKIKENVLSILSNMGALSLEKTYNVLKATTHNINNIHTLSIDDLESVMTALIDEKKTLCLPNGYYKLFS